MQRNRSFNSEPDPYLITNTYHFLTDQTKKHMHTKLKKKKYILRSRETSWAFNSAHKRIASILLIETQS